MLPFKLTTFSETYSNYLEYYKYHYGQSKIDEVKRKIQNSNPVKKLFEESSIRRGVLTGKDYVIAMNSITYFMFSKKETIILGALIALKLWNETINSFYYLASEDRLAQITYKIFQNLFNLNEKYISTLFKAEYNITPSRYVGELRLNMAKNLMQNNPEIRVKDVAELVGFTDYFYFSRVFKSHEGVTPSQYIKSISTTDSAPKTK